MSRVANGHPLRTAIAEWAGLWRPLERGHNPVEREGPDERARVRMERRREDPVRGGLLDETARAGGGGGERRGAPSGSGTPTRARSRAITPSASRRESPR